MVAGTEPTTVVVVSGALTRTGKLLGHLVESAACSHEASGPHTCHPDRRRIACRPCPGIACQAASGSIPAGVGGKRGTGGDEAAGFELRSYRSSAAGSAVVETTYFG